MNKHGTRSIFNFLSCSVFGVVFTTALGGAAVQAQSIRLTSAPPGQTAAITDAYPTGNALNFISGPFTVDAGSNTVTYMASKVAVGSPSFESFNDYDGSLDFPVPTQLVATFDGTEPTGPLEIRFGLGVSAFGINAESEASVLTVFSFAVYNGTTLLGLYTLPTVDQTQGNSKSVFLGAQATGGNLITRIDISSGTNDFYVGPLSIYSAAVPEASTLVSFSLLLSLGLVIVGAARKKA
ncbi:MAG: hypothetical protein ACRYFS_05075 [Janthinobacterium lividum]